MKILVFSDSHMYLDYMVQCVQKVKPDVLIHLGDYYADALALTAQFPDLPMYAVPGNGDQERYGQLPPVIRLEQIGGVRFYLTHGHKHGVKFDLNKLRLEAKRAGADAVLFGHTHRQYRECVDGLWIINPGSCGAFSAGAAIIETENEKISRCALMTR